MSYERVKRKIPYYLLMAPAVILSTCVILIPSVTTIVSSFTDWNGVSADMNFVGFQNYMELIGNSVFRKALSNNCKWMVMYLIIPVLIAMVAAVCLLKQKKRSALFQVLFLFPYVIAPIANALIWLNMIYSPLTGLVGFMKTTFKWGGLASPLAMTNTALIGVAAADIWHYWGYLAVVFFSALRQTPNDYVEAAIMDGCNGWQLFRYIYFPCMLPTFKMMIVLIVIQSFLQFDYVYLLTSGGPAHATEMLGTMAYNHAFTLFQFGKSAAIAVMMSLLGLVASIAYARMSRNESL